jgi:transposase
MRDVDAFTKLLALKRPWGVEQVIFDEKEKSVSVFLRHRGNARFRCPKCGAVLPLHDHAPSRRWRHLDHGSWLTWLYARLPRVNCLFHGVQRVRVPWALAGARFTLEFETHAINTLLETDVLGASRLLRLSWHETWGVMERAVARGLKAKRRRVIPYLGVDEKSIAKRHRYATVVCDLKRGIIDFVAFDRKKTSLDAFYLSLSPKQLAGIRGVAMDMWDPFIASTRQHVADAEGKIVFDRFHIMKKMLEAVDAVRKAEHRRLTAEDDDTLKGTKYFWFFSAANFPEEHKKRFADLKRMHLQTGRAWAIKESLRDFWSYQRRGWALRHWKAWYRWATRSRLKPVIKVARMIKDHLPNVMTYFDHRITNAMSEGLNSKIQTVKKTPAASVTGSISRSPSTFTAAASSSTPSKSLIFREIRRAKGRNSQDFYPLQSPKHP